MVTSTVLRPRLGASVGTAALCVLATAGIVLQQELHTPLGLPGYRGLFWLTLLVAVRLVARRPGPTLATAAASSALVVGLGLSGNGALGALPYVLAALALDATAFVPALRDRAWALAALAAPVHLLALATPVGRSLVAGVAATALARGMTSVVLLHLAFGAAAGALGWALAAAWRRALQ